MLHTYTKYTNKLPPCSPSAYTREICESTAGAVATAVTFNVYSCSYSVYSIIISLTKMFHGISIKLE